MNATTISRPRTATLALTMAQQLAKCATRMTKFQLFSALGGGQRKINGQWINDAEIEINGHKCILSAIMREDGSGSSFILTVYGPDNNSYKSLVRTID